MSRTKRSAGEIAFVGVGPGDPGLLTRRALATITQADFVLYDRGIAPALLEWIKAEVPALACAPKADPVAPGASGPDGGAGLADEGGAAGLHASAEQIAAVKAIPALESPAGRSESTGGEDLGLEPGRGSEPVEFAAAEGGPEIVLKALLAQAAVGQRACLLIAGDPYEHEAVVRQVRWASAAGVALQIIPGISRPGAVATFAGITPGSVRTTVEVDDAGTADFASLARAAAGPGAAIAVDAGDLGQIRDGLVGAGLLGAAAVSVTGDGTGEAQYTAISTVDNMVSAALGFGGRVVLGLGLGVADRDRLGWWENRPLYGWKVLVPRTKEQAGAMSARLRTYGAIPCEVPTIAVEPPRTPAQMERAIKGLVDGRYAWTIFTSANAVRAVLEKFGEHGLDARHFGGVKIACVGEATADAVRAFGIEPELMPTGEQSGEGLLAEFSPHDEMLDPVSRILLPRADIATEALAAGLTERGWEVDDVTAYRTVRAAPPPAEVRDAIKSGGFDAVLFTSSSTVRNLVGIAGKPHARTVVAVIGPKTADTAVEFGLRVDVQPVHASVPDLVEALAGYAVELREKLAAMPAKQRRGSKIQGPTGLRLR